MFSRSIDRKIEEQSRVIAKRFKENDKKFDEMMKMMHEMSVNCSTEGPRDDTTRSSAETTRPETSGGNPFSKPLDFTLKVEFLKFDGNGERNWVKKCVKYSTLCKIRDD